jgi:hypothetical protein
MVDANRHLFWTATALLLAAACEATCTSSTDAPPPWRAADSIMYGVGKLPGGRGQPVIDPDFDACVRIVNGRPVMAPASLIISEERGSEDVVGDILSLRKLDKENVEINRVLTSNKVGISGVIMRKSERSVTVSMTDSAARALQRDIVTVRRRCYAFSLDLPPVSDAQMLSTGLRTRLQQLEGSNFSVRPGPARRARAPSRRCNVSPDCSPVVRSGHSATLPGPVCSLWRASASSRSPRRGGELRGHGQRVFLGHAPR